MVDGPSVGCVTADWASGAEVEMIVTIDGPAGAGKSSVARALAQRLGFRFLDTGAMYRAVAWAACQAGVELDDAAAVGSLAETLQLEMDAERVLVGGRDVTRDIRSPQVTAVVHFAADHPHVRQLLRDAQRRFAERGSVITEGRDQGTDVFPDAQCKIFLTASPEERARRRLQQLERQGEHATLDEVLAEQNARDQRDAQRPVGRLVAAPDAVHVLTDGLSYQQVLDRLEQLVRSRLPAADSAAGS